MVAIGTYNSYFEKHYCRDKDLSWEQGVDCHTQLMYCIIYCKVKTLQAGSKVGRVSQLFIKNVLGHQNKYMK